MRYYNIKTEEFESIALADINTLVQTYDCLKDSISSIVDEIKEKIETGEELSISAYNVIFENFDYKNNSLSIIEFLKKLMSKEEFGELPILTPFAKNSEILINKYSIAMDYFFESDLSEFLQPQVIYDPPETNCAFLQNFMYKINLTDKENQDWLRNKIKEWKTKAGEQFATIATNFKNNESITGYSPEDYLNMANRALSFDPQNIKALQLKNWYYEQQK